MWSASQKAVSSSGWSWLKWLKLGLGSGFFSFSAFSFPISFASSLKFHFLQAKIVEEGTIEDFLSRIIEVNHTLNNRSNDRSLDVNKVGIWTLSAIKSWFHTLKRKCLRLLSLRLFSSKNELIFLLCQHFCNLVGVHETHIKTNKKLPRGRCQSKHIKGVCIPSLFLHNSIFFNSHRFLHMLFQFRRQCTDASCSSSGQLYFFPFSCFFLGKYFPKLFDFSIANMGLSQLV